MMGAELLLQGVQALQAGNLEQAEAAFRRALEEDPDSARGLHLLGVVLDQRGRHGEAAALIARAVSLEPGDAEAFNSLGNALRAAGRLDEAAAAYQDALALDGDSPWVLYNLGSILIGKGKAEQAEILLHRAVELEPGFAQAWNNLGVTRRAIGDALSAEVAFRRALNAQPDYASAANNLALTLHDQGRRDAAVSACREALRLDPALADAHRNLGVFLRGDPACQEEAGEALERAAALRPDWGQPLADLAQLLFDRSAFEDAVKAARAALERDPGLTPASRLLGQILFRRGDWRDAAQVFLEAERHGGGAAMAVRRALVVPVVPENWEEIREGRDRMKVGLEAFIDSGATLANPSTDIGIANFYTAYHGLDDRPLQELLARAYLGACPDLEWTADHCREREHRAGRRVRLGIASPNFIDRHTVGKMLIGVIDTLPRERFEVVLFRTPNMDDVSETRAVASVDRVVTLPADFHGARQCIAAEKLDVLFYPDIGMAPQTYFLAFARLAPVQCVTWGHPMTTGIPNMDYFLSSPDLDPEGSEEAYSETLVRLSRPLVSYRRPELSAGDLPGRDNLGLPQDGRLYVSTQSLFKLHPDFDEAIARIAEKDPEGRFVFIAGSHGNLVERLRARLARRHPGAAERTLFLPGLPYPSFLGLTVAADVLLDTFPFCGGNTNIEAFAYAMPVVTLPTTGPRGRFTAALYRWMGVTDLVAGSVEEYAELAVRVATDRALRTALQARIRDAAPVLFDGGGVVAEFADFLEKALEEV